MMKLKKPDSAKNRAAVTVSLYEIVMSRGSRDENCVPAGTKSKRCTNCKA